jgi:hypothetical protein
LYRPANFASVFAKPFAILAVAVLLADPGILEEQSRRYLMNVTLAVLLFAVMIQHLHITAWYYVDTFAYGWIAIGALLILLVVTVVFNGPHWERWAPMLLAVVLIGEVVIHRVVFEGIMYKSLADFQSATSSTGLILGGPRNPFEFSTYYDPLPASPSPIRVTSWYRWPRRLVYQPMRFQPSLHPFSDHFNYLGAVYHGLWSFLGMDPCIPAARSDSYARWVAAALEPRGVTSWGFSWGQLFGSSDNSPYGLGDDFNVVFGCDQPKLTIDDPAGTAQMQGFTANQASIIVKTPAGGTLTYRDAWTPGWKATVDGMPAHLGRNRYGFKILAVPPGNHQVGLVFRPFVGERILLALAILLTMSVIAQVWLMFWGPRSLDPSSA